MDFNLWLAFLLAALLIAISPGPGAAVSMSSGLRHGYQKTLSAIFGLQTALIIQLMIVAAGLGALLTTSKLAFDIMKFMGAAYLAWLGIQKWRSAPSVLNDDEKTESNKVSLFRQGLLVNLTNPKAIVFMAALTPQFIDPSRPQAIQFLIIGLTMCGVDVVIMSGYALLASHLRKWLRNPKAMRIQDIFFGSLFFVAGIALAFSGRS